MKKNDIEEEKKPYIFVIVVLVILTIVILILLKVKSKDNNIDVGESTKISTRKEQVVKKRTSFFALQNMINTFVSYDSNESVYGLLDKDYINENGVTVDNAIDLAHQGKMNLSFKMQEYSNVDLSDINKNIYIVKGILIQNGLEYQKVIDKEYSVILLIDYDNYTFSIIPDTDKIPSYIKSKNTFAIEKNEYNKITSIVSKTRYEYCSLYYNDFVFKVNYLLDDAKKLVSDDSEVNVKKFDLTEAFSNSPKIKTCNYDGDIKRYSIEDTNGNKLDIKENSIMNYTVYLK